MWIRGNLTWPGPKNRNNLRKKLDSFPFEKKMIFRSDQPDRDDGRILFVEITSA